MEYLIKCIHINSDNINSKKLRKVRGNVQAQAKTMLVMHNSDNRLHELLPMIMESIPFTLISYHRSVGTVNAWSSSRILTINALSRIATDYIILLLLLLSLFRENKTWHFI